MIRFISLFICLIIASSVSFAEEFRLEPGDPHFIKKVDPSNTLWEQTDLWLANAIGKTDRPEIWFKLPEIEKTGGELKFRWIKDIPNSLGWDSLELFGSKDGCNSFEKIWENPNKWGYQDNEETVRISAGYNCYKFYFVDGDLDWETIALMKKMEVRQSTPTPPPTTPTPPHTPTPFIEMNLTILLILILVGGVAILAILKRRGSGW